MSRSSIVVDLDNKSHLIDLETCIFTFDSVRRKDKEGYSYSFDVDSILLPELDKKDCIADGTFIRVKDLPHEEARIVCEFFGKWNVVGQYSYVLGYLWEGVSRAAFQSWYDMNEKFLIGHYEHDNSIPLILIKCVREADSYRRMKVVAVMPKALKAAIPTNNYNIFLSRYGISRAFDGWKDDSYDHCIKFDYIMTTQTKIRNLIDGYEAKKEDFL